MYIIHVLATHEIYKFTRLYEMNVIFITKFENPLSPSICINTCADPGFFFKGGGVVQAQLTEKSSGIFYCF